jgi:hypothetical protein
MSILEVPIQTSTLSQDHTRFINCVRSKGFRLEIEVLRKVQK